MRSEINLEPNSKRLGPTWGQLGPNLGGLGPTWRHLRIHLGRPGAVLAPTWALLEPCWVVLGCSWVVLEPAWTPPWANQTPHGADRRATWSRVGANLDELGVNWACSETDMGHPVANFIVISLILRLTWILISIQNKFVLLDEHTAVTSV